MKTKVCLKYFVNNCKTSSTSKMKFFLTLVNGLKPLINVTKSSVSTVTDILDTPMLRPYKVTKVTKRCLVKMQ